MIKFNFLVFVVLFIFFSFSYAKANFSVVHGKNHEGLAQVLERLAKIDQAQKTIEGLGQNVVELQNVLTDNYHFNYLGLSPAFTGERGNYGFSVLLGSTKPKSIVGEVCSFTSSN